MSDQPTVDFVLLDVQLLLASASEHIVEAIKTGNRGCNCEGLSLAPCPAPTTLVGPS